MNEVWHYAKNGTPTGPVDESAIRAGIASGEIRPDTLVWKKGEPDWRKASEFFGFESAPPVLAVAAAAVAPSKVPTRMVVSCISMLFFLPFGLVALIYSSKAGSANARGDADAAREAAATALKWAVFAFVAGIAVPFAAGIACSVFSALA